MIAIGEAERKDKSVTVPGMERLRNTKPPHRFDDLWLLQPRQTSSPGRGKEQERQTDVDIDMPPLPPLLPSSQIWNCLGRKSLESNKGPAATEGTRWETL